VDLEQSPEKLLAQWLKAGFLHRRLAKGATEEQFELSVEAASAIRFIRGLIKPRAAATESRLSIVVTQLVALAQSTESAPAARLAALHRERDRIDAEIAEVEAGRWTALPDDRAVERTREILGQADDLVGDFRRVRDEFDTLHRRLRAEVVESEAGRGDVLGKMFEGVDLIASSEAGVTFRAFYSLLIDPTQAAALDEAIDTVLSRDFLGQMDRADRKALRSLTKTLLREAEGGARGDAVLRQEPEGIRHQQRVPGAALSQRPDQGRAARRHAPEGDAAPRGDGQRFPGPDQRPGALVWLLEAVRPRSGVAAAGAWRTPRKRRLTTRNLRAMIAHGEVDFAGLLQDINAVLEMRESASIVDVLTFRPARQGLGSVLGLVMLADQMGMVTGATERVEWAGQDRIRRWSDIPICYFTKEKHDAAA